MLSARPTHSSISSRSRIAVAHAFSILSSQRAGRSAGRPPNVNPRPRGPAHGQRCEVGSAFVADRDPCRGDCSFDLVAVLPKVRQATEMKVSIGIEL